MWILRGLLVRKLRTRSREELAGEEFLNTVASNEVLSKREELQRGPRKEVLGCAEVTQRRPRKDVAPVCIRFRGSG